MNITSSEHSQAQETEKSSTEKKIIIKDSLDPSDTLSIKDSLDPSDTLSIKTEIRKPE